MPNVLSAIACNLDSDMLLAALPLFESERVQAMEWAFDTLFKVRNIPPWFVELLKTYGQEGRLIGHGVYFSLFSGKWSAEQQDWLARLKRMSAEFRFDHVTEHFGFMTGADFHKGAPISIPFTPTTLALGQDRLKRIADACQCPVGLENLAFSYSLDEVRQHGVFLEKLVEPVNGFIILDLHNLYCQLHNFQLDFETVIDSYPLHRVREIHISGGSWENSGVLPGSVIRRDTHDEAVPAEVFHLLEQSLQKCPQVKYVVLEQLGSALHTEDSRRQFQQDFYTLDRIVEQENRTRAESAPRSKYLNDFSPTGAANSDAPLEDVFLFRQQTELSTILETAVDYTDARNRLQASSLAGTAWQPERWAPEMLETAIRIAQKWKDGFA